MVVRSLSPVSKLCGVDVYYCICLCMQHVNIIITPKMLYSLRDRNVYSFASLYCVNIIDDLIIAD